MRLGSMILSSRRISIVSRPIPSALSGRLRFESLRSDASDPPEVSAYLKYFGFMREKRRRF